jgi:uncharacterized protein YjiS (DUF1127 family)
MTRILHAIGHSEAVATSLMTRLLDTFETWTERARERRMLAAASETLLADLGRSRAEILDEAEKPFWRS